MRVADALHETRTSDCSTAPFRHMASADSGDKRDIDNGYLEGGVAISLYSHTYTGARMAIMDNNMPTVKDPASPSLDYVVDFRLCVWDYDTQELRATTDNLASIINGLPRGAAFDALPEKYLLEADLMVPLRLRQGEWVLLGTAYYGDYPAKFVYNVSVNCFDVAMQVAPQMGFNNKTSVTPAHAPGEFPTGGYTGGIPGSVGTDVSGNAPWMDLIHEPDDPANWPVSADVEW